MKNKRVILSTLLFLLSSLCLYSAEAVEAPADNTQTSSPENITHFREKARERLYNSIEHFIGIRTLLGCDLGIGLRLGLFFPGDRNLKLGILADIIYRKSTNAGRSAMSKPRLLGGNLMAAMKVNGFYWGTGGFVHIRLSDELVYGSIPGQYAGILYTRPVDYGIITSIGYIDTSEGFKWFIGLTFRYSFETSKDKLYEYILSRYNLSFELGIGF
jgi:hypothetical protein